MIDFSYYQREKLERRKRQRGIKVQPSMQMMTIERRLYTNKTTIGNLYVPGKDKPLCHTLEDTVRRTKEKHKTAIPAGRYEIKRYYSNRYGRVMPYLVDVPFFTGIMFHIGNTDKDTSGCILVGKTVMKDFVGYSEDAFNELYKEIERMMETDRLWVEIAGGYKSENWGNGVMV